MIITEANSYSIDVINILGNFSKAGKIHSIFRNSLNLSFEDRLINLSSIESTKTPFGIQIDESVIKYIIDNSSKNDSVLWNEDYKNILFQSINFEIEINKNYYNTQVLPIKINYPNFINNISNSIIFAVDSRVQNGFDKDMMEVMDFCFSEDKTSEDEFYKQLKLLQNSLVEEKLEPEILNYWVGRGKGLTPSGDDFLIGVIALLSTLGYGGNYTRYMGDYLLKEGYKRTTRIGFEYLWYASQGKFSMNIIMLCKAIVHGDNKEVEMALWNLSRSGHTSGIDTMLGIILSSKFIIGKHKDTIR